MDREYKKETGENMFLRCGSKHTGFETEGPNLAAASSLTHFVF